MFLDVFCYVAVSAARGGGSSLQVGFIKHRPRFGNCQKWNYGRSESTLLQCSQAMPESSADTKILRYDRQSSVHNLILWCPKDSRRAQLPKTAAGERQ